MTQDSIFYHEDDYRQVELIPIESLLIYLNEVDKAKFISEESYSDYGFSHVYVRNNDKEPLLNRNITRNEFESILSVHSMFYFNVVYTGYSTQRLLVSNTNGFGFENYVLYYNYQGDLITNSWIVYKSFSDTLNGRHEKLKIALHTLGKAFNLILIDWNALLTVNLKNESALVNYIDDVL